MREYVAALQDQLKVAWTGLQRAAMHQHHDYNVTVQRGKYQAGDLVWIQDVTLREATLRRALRPTGGLLGKCQASLVAMQRKCVVV